jgi:thymidylate synthase
MSFVDSAHRDSGRDEALRIETRTIGEAWLAIGSQILECGAISSYDGLAIRELLLTTISVQQPSPDDVLIARYADPERLRWMHNNFTDTRLVQELGNAESYATRLRDYANSGLDQIKWVVEKLRSDPSSRSATITTLQPLSDTSYVPCVSLLDFYIVHDLLVLVVYAHSIDFGTKGYANLVELAHLQKEVADQLEIEMGSLTMIVKSAHVYESNIDRLSELIRTHQNQDSPTNH